MAITKTTRIESIQVFYYDEHPTVNIQSTTTWDDPDDSELPVAKGDTRQLRKMTETTTYDSETGEATTTESPTDYSGEDAKVIAICDAVWAD